MPTPTPAPTPAAARRFRRAGTPRRLGGLVLAAVTTTAVTAGCSATTEVAPEPVPPVVTAPASAEPEPVTFAPVRGEVVQRIVEDTSIAGSGLYHDGSAPDAAPTVDEAAITAVVDAATAWLDAHLTELHDGGPGRVEEASFTGAISGATSGLASPQRPVAAATYAVVVGARETPEYVRVGVTVTRDDGSHAGATFIFLPEDGEVVLLAVEPGANTDLADDTLDEDPSSPGAAP